MTTDVTAPIRVLIADDQVMVREGFSVLLNAQPDIEVVGEAVDGRQAIAQVVALRPDVVLMDIRMPEVNGLEATREIVAADADAKVLVLTTFDLDEYVYQALRSGASGFLLKDASARQLGDAVRVVAAGEALLAPTITKRLITTFSRIGEAAGLGGPLPCPAGAAGRADRAGERGPGTGRPGLLQRRDRRAADRRRVDGEDACQPDPGEAGAARPHPGGGVRVRGPPGHPWRLSGRWEGPRRLSLPWRPAGPGGTVRG
ncbi:Protein-glutamate methylesterase/protein-glutamine glutaminase [Streptomyces antimycoticus]